MTIKNMPFLLTAAVIFATNYTHESVDHVEQITNELFSRYSDTPRDTTKTPTTPDIIEHQPNVKGPGKIFERKRIYFGKDQNGKPCYAPIWQHAENNPDFGNVKLFILEENSKIKQSRAKHYNFTFLGTYADKDKRPQLKKSIRRAGGLWCPKQNAFLGGTRDESLCEKLEMFDLYAQTYAQQIKHKITK